MTVVGRLQFLICFFFISVFFGAQPLVWAFLCRSGLLLTKWPLFFMCFPIVAYLTERLNFHSSSDRSCTAMLCLVCFA
uniref:Putative secreted peptide n=1 Tax=Anopheles braziliensis TaxID=58242 RepID=A0A2M3ZUP6_9DIPT